MAVCVERYMIEQCCDPAEVLPPLAPPAASTSGSSADRSEAARRPKERWGLASWMLGSGGKYGTALLAAGAAAGASFLGESCRLRRRYGLVSYGLCYVSPDMQSHRLSPEPMRALHVRHADVGSLDCASLVQ